MPAGSGAWCRLVSAGDARPLGVFDSGIGGLTVLAALQRRLAAESTVYLGDTARVPYGTKSAEVVTRYALNNARFLAARNIKLLVVACNTASAVALPALQRECGLPVVGVIEPGARRAADASRTGRVGVIGTEGTVRSGAYLRALEAARSGLEVRQRPCPLFVPLAEEGWGDSPIAAEVARIYLEDWAPGIDVLILGCTHYPLLIPAIRTVLGTGVVLVDSASAVADAVAAELAGRDLAAPAGAGAEHAVFVTDVPGRFCEVGERFLGRVLGDVEQIDLGPG
ncbi:MAG: glutamate racemase [Deltaproteobacteria bacterium]|nr:glutamate racemase [Deltaproteobacteria bacterium]